MASTLLTSEGTEYDWLVAAAAKSAIVKSAAERARRRMRFRATLGCPRPARQSLVAATLDRTVQWIRKATR